MHVQIEKFLIFSSVQLTWNLFHLQLSGGVTDNDNENKFSCGVVYLEQCILNSNGDKDCWNVQYYPKNGKYPHPQNITVEGDTSIEKTLRVNTSSNSRISICDGIDNMGECLQMPKVYTSGGHLSKFEASPPKSISCSCVPSPWKGEWNGDKYFDRNYFGLVYSPFDKNTSSGNDRATLSYTKDEIRAGLENVVTKFTNIIVDASIEDGTNNHSLITSVPQVASEINKKLDFSAIRIILRIDLLSSVNSTVHFAARIIKIFPGTVWAVVVKQKSSNQKNYIDSNILQEISIMRKISFGLKFGIQLSIYTFDHKGKDAGLFAAVNQLDFLLYHTRLIRSFARDEYSLIKVPFKIKSKHKFPIFSSKREEQKMRFVSDTFKIRNSSLSVMFIAGISYSTKLSEFKQFWYRNAKFAQLSKTPVFMFEAIDQPSQIETYSKFGWWKRKGNSLPPVYFEKVEPLLEVDEPGIEEDSSTKVFQGENSSTKYAKGQDTSTKVPKGEVMEEGNFWRKIPLWVKFVAGGALSIVGVISMVTIYFRRKLHQANENKLTTEEVEAFKMGEQDTVNVNDNYAVVLRMPYDWKYELNEEDFVINKSAIMGSGQSGVVFSGRIKNISELVAFKCTTYSSSVTDVKQLMSEIKILSYLGNQENVICLLGAYTRKIQRGLIYVALEYCAYGSLESFLRKLDPKQLFIKKQQIISVQAVCHSNAAYVSTTVVDNKETYSPPQAHSSSGISPSQDTTDDVGFETFLLWSHQIASGMEFLSSKRIVHADLASRNVLLASPENIKISDFGLSKKLYQDVDISNGDDYTPLPWRWMAPESLRNLVFSVETDVWSFGVTIWEIFSLAEVPYHGSSYNLNFAERLEQGLRLPCAKFGNDLIHEKLLPCWNLASAERPSFLELKETFLQLICEFCKDSTELKNI